MAGRFEKIAAKFEEECRGISLRKGPAQLKFKHLERMLNFYDEYIAALEFYLKDLDIYGTLSVKLPFDPLHFESFKKICAVVESFESELGEYQQLYPLLSQ